MKIALVGQPNCGKSTIFNAVAGYRAATGNFPGTTVRLAWSTIRLDGLVAELVDVPGIYSLTSTNPAENAAKKFLLKENVSLIINVLDASLLSRSLELTLELRELGIPMVVCLNMMDEAERGGIKVSSRELSALLRVWPEVSAGMILEVPRYQWPAFRALAGKVWMRLREFVVLSWPLLIADSLMLGLGSYWHFDHYANVALSPLTLVLSLPVVLGTTLVFGVLRKELALIMLTQALGTTSITTVLSSTRIIVFTIFITFHIPCLAENPAVWEEIIRPLAGHF